jgi:hypothetical protein
MLGIQRRFFNSSDLVVCWWNSWCNLLKINMDTKACSLLLREQISCLLYLPVIALVLCFDFFGFPKLNHLNKKERKMISQIESFDLAISHFFLGCIPDVIGFMYTSLAAVSFFFLVLAASGYHTQTI